MNRFGTFVQLLLLGWGSGAVAEVIPLEGLQGLSTVHRYQVHSEALETTYTILVRLPEAPADPEAGAPGKVPAVYLLDGGVTFPALGAYYRYLRFAEDVPDLLIVGISYGTDDWQQGNQRGRDFTAPSSEREHWGGVGAFLDFLEATIFPLVEGAHPADPTRRILFGQSLGGQAVLYAAQQRPGLFWGHIASNPALHRNLEVFLKTPLKAPSKPEGKGEATQRPRVFVASASHDAPRFREPALHWIRHWTTARHPWVLETRTLEGHNHFSVLPESFRQGLLWLQEAGL